MTRRLVEGPSRGRRPRRPSHIDKLEPKSTSAETVTQFSRRQKRQDFGERRRRALRRRNKLIGCGAILGMLAVVSSVIGLIFVSDINERLRARLTADENATALLEAGRTIERDDPFYMLVVGVDARREGERARADTVIVARVDPKTQSAALISIPRDTLVSIPGHGDRKINAASALGGPALLIETVKGFTGLPISHYAEIDFGGFTQIVDVLGGVTVNVPERINDPEAAGYVRAATVIEAGEQRLNGARALTFVRSRQFSSGDFARMQNQQTFLRAVLVEAFKPTNVLRMPALVDTAAKQVTTDMSIGQLLSLANQMRGMKDSALQAATMPGSPKSIRGGSYVVPDEEAFAQMIERMKAGKPLDPSTEDPQAVMLPEDISVTVRNGAGIAGVANDAASRLQAQRYDVVEVGNMNQFVYDDTLVVYKGDDKAKAELVVAALGKGRTVNARGMYAFESDILLVVGKDWGPLDTSRIHQTERQ